MPPRPIKVSRRYPGIKSGARGRASRVASAVSMLEQAASGLVTLARGAAVPSAQCGYSSSRRSRQTRSADASSPVAPQTWFGQAKGETSSQNVLPGVNETHPDLTRRVDRVGSDGAKEIRDARQPGRILRSPAFEDAVVTFDAGALRCRCGR